MWRLIGTRLIVDRIWLISGGGLEVAVGLIVVGGLLREAAERLVTVGTTVVELDPLLGPLEGWLLAVLRSVGAVLGSIGSVLGSIGSVLGWWTVFTVGIATVREYLDRNMRCTSTPTWEKCALF